MLPASYGHTSPSSIVMSAFGVSGFRFGVYAWSYAGGAFDVVFRPSGVFYCPKYPAKAAWRVVEGKLQVEWGKFGNYEFGVAPGDVLDGHALGQPTNWRKITYLRDFNATERALLGEGFGSVWNFEYAQGSFEIEFHCDGYNHFVCRTYPAHSHWLSTDDGLLQIFWGQYGDYELRLDAASGTFQGHKAGQPANWRRATFVRSLSAAVAEAAAHDHSHDHKH